MPEGKRWDFLLARRFPSGHRNWALSVHKFKARITDQTLRTARGCCRPRCEWNKGECAAGVGRNDRPYTTSSPFKDLYTLAGMTTSNDAHSISFGWRSSAVVGGPAVDTGSRRTGCPERMESSVLVAGA